MEESANFKEVEDLAKRSGVSFFHVWYEKVEGSEDDIRRFKVWDVFNQSKNGAKGMTPEKFKEFINNL